MSSPWRIAKASVIGTSHEKSGAPCQDSSTAMLCQCADESCLVLAVSDGAGSAKHSDVGSQRAVQSFTEMVRDYLEDGHTVGSLNRSLMLNWVTKIRTDLELHAAEMERNPRDYSCTLLAVVIDEKDVAFVQIGDGAIVVSEGEGDGWSYVYWPQHGEFANSTNFILAPNLPEIMQFNCSVQKIVDIALFTDGIENLVLHSATKSVHQPFFAEMIQPIRASSACGVDEKLSEGLAQYLASPRICSKTDDDKSLILASRCLR